VDIISEFNKSLSSRLDSVVYTNKTRTWKVPKIITIDWEGVLPEPPKNTSEETKKELQYLEKLTSKLGYEEKNLIDLVDKEPLDLYKPIFSKMGKPIPKKDFEKIWKISEPIVMNLKHKFNRPRPKQLGDLLNYKINVTESRTHHTPAYPSGHTVYAALGAYLFSDMYPHKSSEFFKMISLAGLARCLQGVHYPSDNEASMVISGAIWQDVRYKLFPQLEPYRS
jgi:acid phosphatase (class A)|tara:strand:+ start:141 stop:812 length:672 start_codon:yes stop_codon:yes gene_type:complete